MSSRQHPGAGVRGPLIAAALLAGTWVASFRAYQPLPARSGDTPLAEFSAVRAGVQLQQLLSESSNRGTLRGPLAHRPWVAKGSVGQE